MNNVACTLLLSASCIPHEIVCGYYVCTHSNSHDDTCIHVHVCNNCTRDSSMNNVAFDLVTYNVECMNDIKCTCDITYLTAGNHVQLKLKTTQ